MDENDSPVFDVAKWEAIGKAILREASDEQKERLSEMAENVSSFIRDRLAESHDLSTVTKTRYALLAEQCKAVTLRLNDLKDSLDMDSPAPIEMVETVKSMVEALPEEQKRKFLNIDWSENNKLWIVLQVVIVLFKCLSGGGGAAGGDSCRNPSSCDNDS